MRRIFTTVATVLAFSASVAIAADAYVNLDNDGNIVVSGPFNAVIPKPPGAKNRWPRALVPEFP